MYELFRQFIDVPLFTSFTSMYDLCAKFCFSVIALYLLSYLVDIIKAFFRSF